MPSQPAGHVAIKMITMAQGKRSVDSSGRGSKNDAKATHCTPRREALHQSSSLDGADPSGSLTIPPNLLNLLKSDLRLHSMFRLSS
ncbi:hypothetical protein N7492_000109 [Penicillium capsulatum]|uniref:Uncharacterized protein n=1 Tax=Penicillium capsulatum TaxID=69766 RepID=A0A9W9IQN1_9EURO|nr:hypothetical protein N7492_000109 [Penicillium capsulatum]